MTATVDLPVDPSLPGLVAIRDAGLPRAIPALSLRHVELSVLRYTRGSHATLEALTERRRLAVKVYAEDPTPQVELYNALAAAGLTGESGARVPPLLAFERRLKMLVFAWLEGSTALELLDDGQGERAGELAARWLRRASSVQLTPGSLVGPGRLLRRAGQWVAVLGAAAPPLGIAASALVETLAQTQPEGEAQHLVHGRLHDHHIIDLGDGPGALDWRSAGRGSVELDAGVFLAMLSRSIVLREPLVGEAARAETTFLAGAHDFLDERALAWYWAAALLSLAGRECAPPSATAGDWRARPDTLLAEAKRIAEAAA